MKKEPVPDEAKKRLSPRAKRILMAIGLPIWVFVGFFLAQFVLLAIFYVLEFAGISFRTANTTILNTVLAALVYVFTILIVIVVPVKLKKARVSLEDLGLNRLPSWQDILLAPAGFVVYLLLSGAILSLVIHLIPGFNSSQAQDVGFSGISKQYQYILAFLTLVMIAPIAEEVLMRGYLYGKLKKIMPTFGAMLLTAVTFAALHMQWNVGLDVFALSLVLTSLREVTGNIWAGILLHMLKNGLAFYVLFINPTFLHTIGG